MDFKDKFTDLKKELDSCEKPLFFFDDDIDGLCSFLICYRYKNAGKGVIVKTNSSLTEMFLKKIEEFGPDKVFVLDVPLIDQEFIDQAGKPVVWVDHHGPYLRKNVRYINPRLHQADIYYPTTLVCYTALKNDLWMATAGTVGDAALPDFIEEFAEKYPDILEKGMKDVEEIKFKTRLGDLIALLSFILKGKTQEVLKCVKVLTRIDDPREILDSTTSRGKFVFERAIKIKKYYDQLMKRVVETKEEDGFVIFRYQDEKYSFTPEIANILLYQHPHKIIVVAREKSGEYKMSIRSRDYNISKVIERALQGLSGFGGGHEHAVGAVVKVEDFDTLIDNFRKELAQIKPDN